MLFWNEALLFFIYLYIASLSGLIFFPNLHVYLSILYIGFIILGSLLSSMFTWIGNFSKREEEKR